MNFCFPPKPTDDPNSTLKPTRVPRKLLEPLPLSIRIPRSTKTKVSRKETKQQRQGLRGEPEESIGRMRGHPAAFVQRVMRSKQAPCVNKMATAFHFIFQACTRRGTEQRRSNRGEGGVFVCKGEDGSAKRRQLWRRLFSLSLHLEHLSSPEASSCACYAETNPVSLRELFPKCAIWNFS